MSSQKNKKKNVDLSFRNAQEDTREDIVPINSDWEKGGGATIDDFYSRVNSIKIQKYKPFALEDKYIIPNILEEETDSFEDETANYSLFQPFEMEIKFFKATEDVKTPSRSRDTDAGLDFYAHIPDTFYVDIEPGGRHLFSTGIHIETPPQYFMQLCNRSGLSIKKGLLITGGIVDSGYTGEIKIGMINTSDEIVRIHHQDKIAQGILQKYTLQKLTEVKSVKELGKTDRGDKGFGSSDN